MPPKKKLKPRLHGEGDIRERSDGRLEYRMYAMDPATGKPKRISVYAKTEKELLEKIRKTQLKHAKGDLLQDMKITLGEWLIQHAEAQKLLVRPNTYHKYECYLQYTSSLHSTPLAKLSTYQLDQLYLAMVKEQYSKSSIMHTRSFIGAALNKAVKYGLIQQNPNALTEIPAIKQQDSTTALTEEQAQQLLTALQPSQYYPIFYTILSLGLRHGEALGLQWDDFDWANKTVQLTRAVILENNRITVGLLKNDNAERKIPLHDGLISFLQLHRMQQDALRLERLAQGKDWQDQGWLFCTRAGKPLSQNNVRKAFKRIIDDTNTERKRAGLPLIPRCKIHDLRRTFITYLIGQGVDPKTVSYLVGHSDTRLTLDIYTRTQEHMKKKAVQEIGGLVSQQSGSWGSNGGTKKKPRTG
jgi:integrase